VRILGALGIILAAITGGAQASSLVFPDEPSSLPSIIKLDDARKLDTADTAKANNARSIVALGEPLPDVTYEKVSAIPGEPEARHGFPQSPMIIRGGVVGSAFSAPTPSAAKATAAAPAKATAPATATASAAPSGNARKKSAPPPSAPAQAVQPMPGVGKTE